MSDIIKPRIMDERETFKLSDNEYLFISYAHANSNKIYPFLNKLYDLGINFWYDEKLKVGKSWTEIALKALNDSKCKGILFFVSKEFINSDACEIEVREAYKKILENDFLYIPICVDDENISKQLILAKNEINKKRIAFYQKSVFFDQVLYIRLTDEGIKKLITRLTEEIPGVVNNQEAIINKLLNNSKIKKLDDEYIIELGEYPQNNFEKLNIFPTDNIIFFNEEKYKGIKAQKKFFIFEKIKWKIIDVNENYISIMPLTAIDISKGDLNSIHKKLEEFYEIAFSQKEKECIENIEVLNIEDIINNPYIKNKFVTSTKYMENINFENNDFYWINSKNQIVFCDKKLREVKHLSNNALLKAGIMPKISLKIDNLIK